MDGDSAPHGGRHLLLAEELALLAIAEGSGAFPADPVLDPALAGAILVELRERKAVAIDRGQVTIVERWPTGDDLLDEIVRELEGSPRPVGRCLARIARSEIAVRLVDRLERRGCIAHHREVVLGPIPLPRNGVVAPRFRLHWAVRIHAIARGDLLPDAREHAMLPLLAATRLLRGFVEPSTRGSIGEIARELGRDDPVQAAVVRAIALVEAGGAAVMAAVTA
jgi:hypothetical protein